MGFRCRHARKPSAAHGRGSGGPIRAVQLAGLLVVLFSTAGACLGQQPSSPAPYPWRLDRAAMSLARYAGFADLPAARRKDLIEFVLGNMLLVTAHEIGRAAIDEMQIPVQRKGDVIAAFAVLSSLNADDRFPRRLLKHGAKGLLLADPDCRKSGSTSAYCAIQAIDRGQAEHMMCLLVGSSQGFLDVGRQVKKSPTYQRDCQQTYRQASRRWEAALAPHRRPAEQARQTIDVRYVDAAGELSAFPELFRSLEFLEIAAALATERFAWPRPVALEMRSCGKAEARWIPARGKLELCYELAKEFAGRYRPGRKLPVR